MAYLSCNAPIMAALMSSNLISGFKILLASSENENLSFLSCATLTRLSENRLPLWPQHHACAIKAKRHEFMMTFYSCKAFRRNVFIIISNGNGSPKGALLKLPSQCRLYIRHCPKSCNMVLNAERQLRRIQFFLIIKNCLECKKYLFSKFPDHSITVLHSVCLL